MARLLDVNDLHVNIVGKFGNVPVLRGVSLHVDTGETLALLGGSGAGKTMLCRAIAGILPENAAVTHGTIRLRGREIQGLSERELCRIRGKDIAMIFQNPMTAMNPTMTVGAQIEEAVRVHGKAPRKAAGARTAELLAQVGFPSPLAVAARYPHELSGGMVQRCVIAVALAATPGLLLADEPTTALDATIQLQILELLQRLQQENGIGIILVTHDEGVARKMAGRVAVMAAGQTPDEEE